MESLHQIAKKTINSVEKADKKIDKSNQVDEKKLIEKIQKTEKLLKKFEDTKLKELKTQLWENSYKELEKNLKNLERNFAKNLRNLQNILEKLQENQFQEYQNIILAMQDKFFWVLEIKEWDTVWDIAVKYLWLPKNWKKEWYAWFELVEWLRENENIEPKKLQVWDVIIIWSEFVVLKNLLKYENYIDLKSLIKEHKVKFTKTDIPPEIKFDIYQVLINFFKIKWEWEKAVNLMSDLFELTEKFWNKPISNTEIKINIENNEWFLRN